MSADELKIEGTSGQDVFVGRTKSTQRTVLITCAVVGSVLTLALGIRLFGNFLSADDFFEQSKVRTGVVERGRFERSISVEGNLIATSNPMLYAQDTGVISILVTEGTTVKKGDTLAVIANPELTSRLKRQQSSLELQNVELDTLRNQLQQRVLESDQALTLLKINLEAERRELERMTKIVNDGSISINDYEKIKDRVQALEVQVTNKEQQNELKSKNHVFEIRTKELSIEQQALLVADLDRQVKALSITAPLPGMVGEIQVNEQDTVARNQPILNVVDLSSYQVEVLIPETYAEALQLSLPVRISYKNREYAGTLASISPEVQQGSVAARVEFVDETPSGLRQNLRLNSKVLLESKDNVLKVKRGPFVEAHAGRGVYVQEGDVATYREIQVGSVGISEVEIEHGVKVGETLIISNTAELLGAASVLITDG